MIDTPRKENFDNVLFSEDESNREEEISGTEMPEAKPICQYCEDSGACQFCERGRRYTIDHPLKIGKPKKTKRRKNK